MSQKNKLLYVLTLHCKVYTLQYIPYIKELSRPETSQGQGLLTSLRGYILKIGGGYRVAHWPFGNWSTSVPLVHSQKKKILSLIIETLVLFQ